MKKTTLFITTFIITLALYAGLAWLGGYDFNTRNYAVAYGSALAICVSVITGILAAVFFHGL
jgi:succinate dehydrogenase/fumarate reductase cytochrome b subunit